MRLELEMHYQSNWWLPEIKMPLNEEEEMELCPIITLDLHLILINTNLTLNINYNDCN